jgi:hypothetical protein
MRDVFYTILVIWILWRILHSVNVYRAKKASANPSPSNTNTESRNVHSAEAAKRKMADNEGEYVEYEELK